MDVTSDRGLIAGRFCLVVEKSGGFPEYFDALTGEEAQRSRGCTWTAAVYLLLWRYLLDSGGHPNS